jgi:hypothetical protein
MERRKANYGRVRTPIVRIIWDPGHGKSTSRCSVQIFHAHGRHHSSGVVHSAVTHVAHGGVVLRRIIIIDIIIIVVIVVVAVSASAESAMRARLVVVHRVVFLLETARALTALDSL